MQPSGFDEERLARGFAGLDRKALGAYFTPAWLVQQTLTLALAHAPDGPLAVVDPACGAGAFLAAAARALPQAPLFGLELHPDVARTCRERVPRAHVDVGDALRGGLSPLLARVPAGMNELWVGNPPYNGTSALLHDPAAWHHVRELLPVHTPPGTSLRDDFALFLLVAARRLSERPGVLALITPATLLDAYLYAPLREVLLGTLSLRQVVDLGAGAFRDARVHTCITVWTHRAPSPPPVFTRAGAAPRPLAPRAPEWLLTPADEAAEALDARWRTTGEPLTQLVPVSLPGVKTRFDELLVDTDRARLLARLHAFAATPHEALPAFARAHGIPPALVPKLRALKAGPAFEVDEAHVRPFFRYRGAHHRGRVPSDARAWCYLDRRLIPRGDHRLRGAYDPHVGRVKLLFNVRELPLSAALLEVEGCVHDHRHARFAPLLVPERVRELGLEVTRSARTAASLGPLVPNLSARGRAWAERLGGPLEAFRALLAFLNGPEVQRVWAPAFGTTRVVPVPVDDSAAWPQR